MNNTIQAHKEELQSTAPEEEIQSPEPEISVAVETAEWGIRCPRTLVTDVVALTIPVLTNSLI